MVSTMELYSLGRILELEPKLRRGWTYPKVTKDWTSKRWAKGPMLAALVAMRHRLPGLAAEKLPKFGVESMWVYHPLISARLARICKLAGVELIAWTVDDLERMQQARRDRRQRLWSPTTPASFTDSTAAAAFRCAMRPWAARRTGRLDRAGRRRRRGVAAAFGLHRRLQLVGGEAADGLAVEGVAVEGDAEDAAERLRDQHRDRQADHADHDQQGADEAGRGPDQRRRRRSAIAEGSMPIRKTAPPIAMLPVICCPQRD